MTDLHKTATDIIKLIPGTFFLMGVAFTISLILSLWLFPWIVGLSDFAPSLPKIIKVSGEWARLCFPALLMAMPLSLYARYQNIRGFLTWVATGFLAGVGYTCVWMTMQGDAHLILITIIYFSGPLGLLAGCVMWGLIRWVRLTPKIALILSGVMLLWLASILIVS